MLGRRRLPRKIILFAYKLVIVQHIQLFACGQLFPAYEARKTVEVEHFFPRFSDQVGRRDAVPAAATFRAISPVRKKRIN